MQFQACQWYLGIVPCFEVLTPCSHPRPPTSTPAGGRAGAGARRQRRTLPIACNVGAAGAYELYIQTLGEGPGQEPLGNRGVRLPTGRGQGRCLRTYPPGTDTPPGDGAGVYGHTPRGQGRCPRTHPPGTGDSLPGHRPPPGTGTVSRGRIPQESRQPPLRPRLAVPLPGVCVLRDCPLSQMAPPDMDLVLSKARLGSQKPRRCLHPHP